MLREIKLLSAALLAASVLGACAGSYKQTINFDANEPIRVAVLPFVYEDPKGQIVDLRPDLLIDNVPVVSSKLEEAPISFVKKTVSANLEKTGMDIVPSAVVESAFHHHAMSNKLVLETKKIYEIKPQELGDLLDADAVLYGRITEWDRSYYGVETVNSVGIKLSLVSTKTGKELFAAEAKDTDSRGISKGPTGYSSLIVEPVKGLDNEIIIDLARDMVEKMLEPLYLRNRPEFLKSVAPSIYASSHDHSDGLIEPGGHLTVIALGTAGKAASFSIGGKIVNIPMLEKEDGHYIGEYYPLPYDKLSKEQVIVTLADPYGRTTEQKVGMGPVSVR